MSTAEAMTYLGVQPDGTLSACPRTPSGVDSCHPEDKRHYRAPLPFQGSVLDAKERLKAILQSLSNIEIVQEEDNYLHYEKESFLFRIVSDIEFLVDEERQVIHFRAAQRYGFWDMGSNARLIRRVKEIFQNLTA